MMGVEADAAAALHAPHLQVTIQLFINVLKELRQKYKWNIYIHPVVPVLNETRYATSPFVFHYVLFILFLFFLILYIIFLKLQKHRQVVQRGVQGARHANARPSLARLLR